MADLQEHNPTQRLASYYHDLLSVLQSNSSRWMVNLLTALDPDDRLDLSPLCSEELILTAGKPMSFRGPSALRRLLGMEAPEGQHLSKTQAFLRLMTLFQKLSLNPYERQLVYGYPLVVGRWNRQTIAAPLFSVPVKLDYSLKEQALILTPNSEQPAFNATFWLEFAGQLQQVFLQEQILPNIPDLPLPLDFIPELVNNLANAIQQLEPLDDWHPHLVGLDQLPQESGADRLKVVPAAALLMIKQGNYYTGKDLDDLSRLSTKDDKSVLAHFWSDRVQVDGDDEELPGPEPIFAFPSNDAQKNVVQALENHRVVVVQGPPGTGKSQTICNLISHLVASGQSVVMTSQKNKSLEVISEKLKTIGHDYLAMTLLKEDQASRESLNKRLLGLDHYLQGLHPTKLKKEETHLLAERERLLEEIEQAEAAFRGAQAIETAHAATFARAFELKDHDRFVGGETPPLDGAPLLGRLFQLRAKLARTLPHFQRWSKACGLDPLIASRPQVIDDLEWYLAFFKDGTDPDLITSPLYAALKGLQRHDWGPLLKALQELKTDLLRYKEREAQWRHRVVRAEEWLGLSLKLGPLADLNGLVRQLDHIEQALGQAKAMPDLPYPVHADPDKERHLVLQALDDYRSMQKSLLKTVSNRFKLAQTMLAKVLRCSTHELPRALPSLEMWLDYQRSRDRLLQLVASLPEALFPQDLAQAIRRGDAPAAKAGCQLRSEALAIAHEQATLEARVNRLGLPVLPWAKLAAMTEPNQVQALFSQVVEVIEHLANKAKAVQIEDRWHLDYWKGLLDPLREAYARGDVDEVERICHKLASWVKQTDRYLEMIALERGPLLPLVKTLKKLTRDWDAGDQVALAIAESPELLWEAYEARLEAEKARAQLQGSTDAYATIIRQCRKKLAEVSKRLLAVRLDRNLQRLMVDPKAANDLQYFRKTLKAKRKSYRKFEELKENFDFETLLKVIPSWIVGIDDVTRLFPLQPGLFDVLIIDEASQCSVAAALPLMYRAKKIIVVGDEHQLPNADVMFLATNLNDDLIQRHKVSALPRYEVFDAQRNSLLDTCACFSDRRIFLNEHFRCFPEIVRFSNDRFYDGQLRILTDSSLRRYGDVFKLRLVEDGDDDLSRKVNEREAEVLVDDLIAMMTDPLYHKATFGVLSLYREQANHIEAVLRRRLIDRPNLWNDHQLIVSTVDGFQGDERDIILYSFRYGPSSPSGVVQAIQNDYRRINVAFTRAREQVICYFSRPIDQFPNGLIRDFLVHASNPRASEPKAPLRYRAPHEIDLVRRLTEHEIPFTQDYWTCGFHVPVILVHKGRRLALEFDGNLQRGDDLGHAPLTDLARQEVLERAGWLVVRISPSAYWNDPEAVLNDLVSQLTREGAPQDRPLLPVPDDEPAVTLSEIIKEPAGTSKPIDQFSDEALTKFVLSHLTHDRGAKPHDLIAQTSKSLGYKRMGPKIKARLDTIIQQATHQGLLIANGDYLFRPETETDKPTAPAKPLN